MNLTLSLKRQWFEMTEAGIKREDYREINDYWCNVFLLHRGDKRSKNFWKRCYLNMYTKESFKKWFENELIHGITPISFDQNIMTLGYPKKDDNSRRLIIEHKGIEIRTGNPEWGAEPGKIYFVIKHGKILNR